MGAEADLERAELFKLYEYALQEYRFQVLLNWDRTKHAIVIDGVLLGATAGVLKLADPSLSSWVGGILLFILLINSSLGAMGTRKGHEYYRAIRKHKATLEERLGLVAKGIALATTAGMAEDHSEAAAPLTPRGRLARWSGRLTTYAQFLLWMVSVLSLAGLVWIVSW